MLLLDRMIKNYVGNLNSKNGCRFSTKCRFEHRCSFCGITGHSLNECRRKPSQSGKKAGKKNHQDKEDTAPVGVPANNN